MKRNDPIKKLPKVDEADLQAYQVGATVSHRRFGKGQIISRNGDVVNVQFEKVGNKKMNLSVCLENGVIH
jgi:hypothetical protein